MSARRFLIPLALALCIAPSCREGAPTAPDRRVPTLQASSVYSSSSGLLQCSPLAYDSVTAVIGPGGGNIRVSKHVLSIPGGALTQSVSITVIAPSDTMNRIQFQPEGLTFKKPLQLTMSYANCNINPSAALRIAYLDASGAIVEYVPSTDDLIGKKVTGWIAHFSDYAVAF